jgi:hypothetical protein
LQATIGGAAKKEKPRPIQVQVGSGRPLEGPARRSEQQSARAPIPVVRVAGKGVDEGDVHRIFGGCVSASGRSLGRRQIQAVTPGTKRLPGPARGEAARYRSFSLPPSGSVQIFGCSGALLRNEEVCYVRDRRLRR